MVFFPRVLIRQFYFTFSFQKFIYTILKLYKIYMNILIEDFNNQNKDIIKNNVKSELK